MIKKTYDPASIEVIYLTNDVIVTSGTDPVTGEEIIPGTTGDS